MEAGVDGRLWKNGGASQRVGGFGLGGGFCGKEQGFKNIFFPFFFLFFLVVEVPGGKRGEDWKD
jgi:hypothetical protein